MWPWTSRRSQNRRREIYNPIKIHYEQCGDRGRHSTWSQGMVGGFLSEVAHKVRSEKGVAQCRLKSKGKYMVKGLEMNRSKTCYEPKEIYSGWRAKFSLTDQEEVRDEARETGQSLITNHVTSVNYHCTNGKLLKGFDQGRSWLCLYPGKIPLAAEWRMD